MSGLSKSLKFTDIGANLLDDMFRGIYNGNYAHPADFRAMLSRAGNVGVHRIMITGTDLNDSRNAFEFCSVYRKVFPNSKVKLFHTVGVHPTSTMQLEGKKSHRHAVTKEELLRVAGITDEQDIDFPVFESESKKALTKQEYFDALREVIRRGIEEGVVVAVGECGLDYDRLHFSPKEVQLRHFDEHFKLTEEFGLPMFLHDRNTGMDFYEILKENRHRFTDAVVHSFTGPADVMQAYLDLGLYIGINGCSLKTEENLEVVKQIPLDRLMIETDAPWCTIRSTHASNKYVATQAERIRKDRYTPDTKLKDQSKLGPLVKERCEPCEIVSVAEVVAALKGVSVEEVSRVTEENVTKVFFSRSV